MNHTLDFSAVEVLQPPEFTGGWVGHDSFLEQNKPYVDELLVNNGILPQGDLSKLVEATQPWVGEHHADTESAGVLTEEQRIANRLLFEKMGLVEEVALPAGEYNHIVVLGGLQSANNLRVDFLNRMFASGDVRLSDDAQISLWGGVRPTIPEVETDWIVENQASLSVQRRADSSDPWLSRLSLSESVADESEGLRLATHRQLGDIALHRVDLKIDERTAPVSDGPVVKSWQFTSQERPVVLINAKAVGRGAIGAPRHTTESCAEQWLEMYGATLPENARIGFVTSQPYGLRTTRATQNIVDKLGRPDLQIVGGGPAVHAGIKDHTFRGEVARNIYEDSKHGV